MSAALSARAVGSERVAPTEADVLIHDLNKISGQLTKGQKVTRDSLNSSVNTLNRHILALTARITSQPEFVDAESLKLLQGEVRRIDKITIAIEAKCLEAMPFWRRWVYAIAGWRAGPKVEHVERFSEALKTQERILKNESEMAGKGALVARGSAQVFEKQMKSLGKSAAGAYVIVPTDRPGEYNLVIAQKTGDEAQGATPTTIPLTITAQNTFVCGGKTDATVSGLLQKITGGAEPVSLLKKETINQIRNECCVPGAPLTVEDAEDLLEEDQIVGDPASRFLVVPTANEDEFDIVVEGAEEEGPSTIRIKIDDHGAIFVGQDRFSSWEDYKSSKLGSFALPDIQDKRKEIYKQLKACIYDNKEAFEARDKDLSGLFDQVANTDRKPPWIAVIVGPPGAGEDNWTKLTVLKREGGYTSRYTGWTKTEKVISVDENGIALVPPKFDEYIEDALPLKEVEEYAAGRSQKMSGHFATATEFATSSKCLYVSKDLATAEVNKAILALGNDANGKAAIVLNKQKNQIEIIYKEAGKKAPSSLILDITDEGFTTKDDETYGTMQELFKELHLSSISSVSKAVENSTKLLEAVKKVASYQVKNPENSLGDFYTVLQDQAVGTYAFSTAIDPKSGQEQINVHYIDGRGVVQSQTLNIAPAGLPEGSAEVEKHLVAQSGFKELLTKAFLGSKNEYDLAVVAKRKQENERLQREGKALESNRDAFLKNRTLDVTGSNLGEHNLRLANFAKKHAAWRIRDALPGTDYTKYVHGLAGGAEYAIDVCPSGGDASKIKRYSVNFTKDGRVAVSTQGMSGELLGTFDDLNAAISAVCPDGEKYSERGAGARFAIMPPREISDEVAASKLPAALKKKAEYRTNEKAILGLVKAYQSYETIEGREPSDVLGILEKALGVSGGAEVKKKRIVLNALLHPDKSGQELKELFQFWSSAYKKCEGAGLFSKEVGQSEAQEQGMAGTDVKDTAKGQPPGVGTVVSPTLSAGPSSIVLQTDKDKEKRADVKKSVLPSDTVTEAAKKPLDLPKLDRKDKQYSNATLRAKALYAWAEKQKLVPPDAVAKDDAKKILSAIWSEKSKQEHGKDLGRIRKELSVAEQDWIQALIDKLP